MVPSVFLRWDEHHQKLLLTDTNLKALALGGENFPRSILQFPRKDTLGLYNLYGTTEVSCWATIYKIQDENSADEVPLGNSLEDTVIKVKDEKGDVVYNGCGEIYIGEDFMTF